MAVEPAQHDRLVHVVAVGRQAGDDRPRPADGEEAPGRAGGSAATRSFCAKNRWPKPYAMPLPPLLPKRCIMSASPSPSLSRRARTPPGGRAVGRVSQRDVERAVRAGHDVAGAADLVGDDRGAEARGQRDAAVVGRALHVVVVGCFAQAAIVLGGRSRRRADSVRHDAPRASRRRPRGCERERRDMESPCGPEPGPAFERRTRVEPVGEPPLGLAGRRFRCVFARPAEAGGRTPPQWPCQAKGPDRPARADLRGKKSPRVYVRAGRACRRCFRGCPRKHPSAPSERGGVAGRAVRAVAAADVALRRSRCRSAPRRCSSFFTTSSSPSWREQ